MLVTDRPGVDDVLLEETAVREGDQLVAVTDVEVEAEVVALVEPDLIVPAVVAVREEQHVMQGHVGSVGGVDAVAARLLGSPGYGLDCCSNRTI
jgi:hypothetical protein